MSLIDRARRSSPRVVNESARAALTKFLELDVEQSRFYDGPAADEANRRLGSDALSAGQDIFFRRGAFAPDEPRGLALIGHELTHAEASREAALHRLTIGPADPAEERRAIANELRVLHEFGIPARPSQQAMTPLLPGSPPQAPAQTPSAMSSPMQTQATGLRAAEANRLEATGAAPPRAESLTDRQLAELKEALYHDLRERLRMDQERGA
ncbi:MAG: DUF4157 domain-containing protein [Isosphaeraceae bacterium]